MIVELAYGYLTNRPVMPQPDYPSAPSLGKEDVRRSTRWRRRNRLHQEARKHQLMCGIAG
jgi:hypothetical protein